LGGGAGLWVAVWAGVSESAAGACRPAPGFELHLLMWCFEWEPAGAFRPAPGVPFVLPKGTKSAPPASAPLRGAFRCSQAQARPKLTPLASLVPFKQLGGVSWVAGSSPAPGLAVLLSASGRGNSRAASSQQPGNGAVAAGRGCWAVGCSVFGCFRHLHPAEAHSDPGACASKLQLLAPTHCLSGVSEANAASLSRPPGCEHCREPRRGGVPGGALFPPFGKTKGGPGAGRTAPAGCTANHH
jgi:hypothetical protein